MLITVESQLSSHLLTTSVHLYRVILTLILKNRKKNKRITETSEEKVFFFVSMLIFFYVLSFTIARGRVDYSANHRQRGLIRTIGKVNNNRTSVIEHPIKYLPAHSFICQIFNFDYVKESKKL